MTRTNWTQRLLYVFLAIALFLLYRQNSVQQARRHSRGALSKDESSRIAIVSMTTRETSYDHMAISNKEEYAHKHGYDMRFAWKGDKGFWDKLRFVEDALRMDTYDWVWWVDFDILVMNMGIRLEDIIQHALEFAVETSKNPNDIDLIVTPDCFPLNAGSMIFRNSPWIRDFFAELWNCERKNSERGDSPYSEQDCMRDMIKDNTVNTAQRSVTINQTTMNAFPEEIPCYDHEGRHWERGMFAIHFAGAWAHIKEEDPVGILMRKYGPMVEH